MAPNSSGEANWPLTSTIAEICWSGLLGSTPMLPEATCAFCALIALVTSSAVRLNPTSRRRIDPDAQRALGRVERGAADAGNAADLAQNVAHHEVAEPDLVEAAVGRAQRDDLQHRARGFLDQNALLHDGARQARLDALDAVLHLDRSRRWSRCRERNWR